MSETKQTKQTFSNDVINDLPSKLIYANFIGFSSIILWIILQFIVPARFSNSFHRINHRLVPNEFRYSRRKIFFGNQNPVPVIQYFVQSCTTRRDKLNIKLSPDHTTFSQSSSDSHVNALQISYHVSASRISRLAQLSPFLHGMP